MRLFKHYISAIAILIFAGDLFILAWSAHMGYYIRFYHAESGVDTASLGWASALTFALVGQFSLFLMDLYRFDVRHGLSTLFKRLAIAFVIFFVGLTSIFYMAPHMAVGRGVFVIAFALSVVMISVWRGSLNWTQSSLRVRSRVAVLGAGTNAAMIEELLRGVTDSGYDLVGFISEGDETEPTAVTSERILGGKNDLLHIVSREKIDRIVVALSDRRGNFPLRSILDCKMRGVDVLDLPAFYERLTGKILIRDLRPSWLIFCDGFRRTELTRIVKRASDIIFAAMLLAVTFPIMFLTAFLIRMESRGSVFFRQERVGEHGKIFTVVKFRSMRVDAEKESGPVWAVDSDDRVTRVGRFIRKTRIDELPQLVNILRGEMSFIGPRPERPYFVAQLQEKIPYYSQRHTVKPGLTGWAQVRYQYGASVEDAHEKLQYDLYYIKNMSIFLDALVLFDTVRVVLFGKGAR